MAHWRFMLMKVIEYFRDSRLASKICCLLLLGPIMHACKGTDEWHEKADVFKLVVSSDALMNPSEEDIYPRMKDIGLFSLDWSGKRTEVFDNQKAVYNGRKWYLENGREVWLGTDSMNVYTYSPFVPGLESDTWLPVRTGDVDYMYGRHLVFQYGFINRYQPVAYVNMVHSMAFIKMDLRPIREQLGKISRIAIRNTDINRPVYETAELNLLNGEIRYGAKRLAGFECVMHPSGDMAYLYAVPCKDSSFNIEIVVNGKLYTMAARATALEGAKMQNFWLDFDVKQMKLFLRDITIQPWDDRGEIEL